MTTKVMLRPTNNQIVERVVTTKGLTTKVLATKWLTWSASTPPLFCESPPILPGSCQERFPLADEPERLALALLARTCGRLASSESPAPSLDQAGQRQSP